MSYRLVGCLLIVLGCDSAEDVRIARDAPGQGREGSMYSHTFAASRPVEDAWFIDCRPMGDRDDAMQVERDGTLSFTPARAGTFDVCVEYRRVDGAIDKYAYVVEVEATPDPEAEERRAKLAAFRKRLPAIHAATTAITQPRVTACPTELPEGMDARVDAFDEHWLGGDKDKGLSIFPRQLYPRDVVVVTRPDRLAKPTISWEEGKPLEHVSGAYVGHAFVVDVAKAEILCTRPLTFKNSPRVEWKELIHKDDLAIREAVGTDKMGGFDKALEAVDRDWRENGVKALKALVAATPFEL